MQLLKVSNYKNDNNNYVYDTGTELQNILRLNPNFVKQHYITLFDKAYLNCISYRQQRDLLLINEFYKYITTHCQMQTKFFKTINIVNNLMVIDEKNNIVEMNSFDLCNDIAKTNAKLLEKEMKYLKSLNEMFINMKIFKENQDKDIIKSIRAKINKVSTICDESFLSQITKNKTIQKEIISKLPKIIKFAKIKVNIKDINNITNF